MNNGFVIEGGPGLWELDKIVSEEFHLEHRYAEVDSFGHFVFPEAQEKDWDGGDQSISWAGLLHGIAYYSSIPNGRRDKFEILGAMYEMMELAYTLPQSAFVFVSNLLDFFESQQMYVRFTYTAERKRIPADNDCFVKRGKKTIFRKTNGLFECDSDGNFSSYFPDSEFFPPSQDAIHAFRLANIEREQILDYRKVDEYYFDSFYIKRAKTNTIVNFNEVDRMVCEKFDLETSETDCGRFIIPEAKDPNVNWSQESIYWDGLLHCIVYYSNIGYGYRNTYEVLAAIEEMRHGIGYEIIMPRFPLSVISFVARLLDFLKTKGLYFYVNYDDSEDRDLYENLTHTEKLKLLKTDSGWFECNDNGTLMNFYPDLNKNSVLRVDKSLCDHHRILHLRHFIIPEGVKSFSMLFLRKGWDSENLVFPQSFDEDICEINHYSIRDKELTIMMEKPQKYEAEKVKKTIELGVFSTEELVQYGLATNRSIQAVLEGKMIGCEYCSDYETSEGCTDVFFFGCTGVGKTSLLEGLIGCNGQSCIFNYEIHGGPYAMELSKFLEKGWPSSPNAPFVTTINGAIGNKAVYHPINLVEMDGWTFVSKIVDCDERCAFAKKQEMLNDKNRKVFFIVVDPSLDLVGMHRSKGCQMRQLEVIDKFIASFEMPENKEFMRNVDAIHFIVTKADTLGKTQEERNHKAYDLLINKHRGSVCKLIDFCRKTKRINRTTDFQPRIFTFSLGKFYVGNTFEYDSKDSLYLIDALRHMTYGIKEPTLMNKIFKSLAVVQPKRCDYGMEINIE